MKRGYVILAVLILYSLAIFLPPLVYGYVYPNNSDDTAFHLAYFDRIKNGEALNAQYSGQNIVGFPLVWASKAIGVSIDVLFLWFNFVVLWLVGISAFALVAKFIDWRAGLLAIPMVMFMTPSTLNLFDTGAIYDLMTIGVILPMLLFCGMQLWATKKWYWSIPLLVSLTLVVIVHSTVIMKTIAMGNSTGEKAIPTLAEFVGILLGYSIVLLLVVSLVVFVWNYKRLNMDGKAKLLLACLAFIIITLTILVFTGAIGWSLRIAIDLAIVLPLFVACLVGVILKVTKIPVWAVALCVVVSSVSLLSQYAEYNSAMKPADMEAIVYVNGLSGEYYSCSPEVAPWIYDRFLNKEYREGELPYIVRSKPMTSRTTLGHLGYWGESNSTSGYWWSGKVKPKLESVMEIKDGGIQILIWH